LLSFRVALLAGGPLLDRLLLFFALPACELDSQFATAVAAYVELAWATREDSEPLLPVLVRARVDAAAAGSFGRSTFSL
jgi:hypothetical protein